MPYLLLWPVKKTEGPDQTVPMHRAFDVCIYAKTDFRKWLSGTYCSYCVIFAWPHCV